MKKKLLTGIVVLALALLAAVQIAGGFLTERDFVSDDNFAFDQRLRHNELRCAHLGVNSFRIWNREMTLPGFSPLERPDMKNAPRMPTDGIVHSYPPWHTVMFYFYGWMPEQRCIALMYVVFGLCLYFIVSECVRLAKLHFEHCGLVVGFALAMVAGHVVSCFVFLNYGVLILALFLFMNKTLETGGGGGKCLLTGLAWSVMMIKPQVGVLFAWPLFWHRRYREIAIAAVFCLIASVVASRLVHESVVDLILQVPQIGMPYGSGILIESFVKPVVGANTTFVIMVAWFALTGVLTWLLHRSRCDFLVTCIPVCVAIPLWTYSCTHDHVILLPVFLLWAGLMFSRKDNGRWIALGLVYCTTTIFLGTWNILLWRGAFNPSGLGWIYHLASLISEMSQITFAAMLVFNATKKEKRDETTAGFHCRSLL